MPAAEQRWRDLESQATIDEIAIIRVLWVRTLTLVLLRWSARPGKVGDDDDLKIAGEPERKGTVEFARLSTPFLDSFCLNDPHTPALLMDYL
jgi:hypothetical protein